VFLRICCLHIFEGMWYFGDSELDAGTGPCASFDELSSWSQARKSRKDSMCMCIHRLANKQEPQR